MRNNKLYVSFIFAGALIGERVVHGTTGTLWEINNQGVSRVMSHSHSHSHSHANAITIVILFLLLLRLLSWVQFCVVVPFMASNALHSCISCALSIETLQAS